MENHGKSWKDPPILIGKLTISMAMFNSYVKLPEGILFCGSFLLGLGWVSQKKYRLKNSRFLDKIDPDHDGFFHVTRARKHSFLGDNLLVVRNGGGMIHNNLIQ